MSQNNQAIKNTAESLHCVRRFMEYTGIKLNYTARAKMLEEIANIGNMAYLQGHSAGARLAYQSQEKTRKMVREEAIKETIAALIKETRYWKTRVDPSQMHKYEHLIMWIAQTGSKLLEGTDGNTYEESEHVV